MGEMGKFMGIDLASTQAMQLGYFLTLAGGGSIDCRKVNKSKMTGDANK